MLTFQEIISNLQNYWSKKGCLVMQPYDMEMGAATFNPFTTLKALGKDPWNAVFTQPCRRPRMEDMVKTLIDFSITINYK